MTTNTQSKKTLTRDAARMAEGCAGIHARSAARAITRFLDQALAPAGLSATQAALMAQIAAAADDTLGDLARRTGLEQSTLSRNLRTLEGAGLIEITAVENDLRRRAVWLTEAGARRLEAALPLWRQADRDLAGLLAPDLARRLSEVAGSLVSP